MRVIDRLNEAFRGKKSQEGELSDERMRASGGRRDPELGHDANLFQELESPPPDTVIELQENTEAENLRRVVV